MFKLLRHFPISIMSLMILLSNCKSNKRNDEIVIPAATLYQNGMDFFHHHQYKKAAEEFGLIFLQHPSIQGTSNAELMQAYSLYLASEYEEAVDVLDIFIKLHPANEDAAYAYYLKALSHYMQISEVTLDQSRSAIAAENLQNVINLFPGTNYAKDCMLKMKLVQDHLAGKEMEEGRFYLKQNNPIGAANRFENVIRQYELTSHTEEALYRLVETYMTLGLKDEASKYAQMLSHNYPDEKWHRYGQSLLHLK